MWLYLITVTLRIQCLHLTSGLGACRPPFAIGSGKDRCILRCLEQLAIANGYQSRQPLAGTAGPIHPDAQVDPASVLQWTNRFHFPDRSHGPAPSSTASPCHQTQTHEEQRADLHKYVCHTSRLCERAQFWTQRWKMSEFA